jgi:hypothetical protein
MPSLSRREFSKRLLAATILPSHLTANAAEQQETGSSAVLDVVAGYRLTDDEKELMRKFVDVHERNMAALRYRDLPNGLPPLFTFEPREMKKRGVGEG